MKLIYIYDPICGWCYGFTPVIQQLQQQFSKEITFEILSGGMMLNANRRPASAMYTYIQDAHKRVEETTGIAFGPAFLNEYLHTDDIMDSEKPSIALTVFKQYQPENAISFAHDMQVALNYDGKSLNDDQTYIELVQKYQLPEQEFLNKMKEEENRYATHEEFNMIQQWGITGFPAAILDNGEQLYLIARGYTPLERILEAITEIKEKNV
ncbi:putative protein-disulfide isomerase [Chitinophaga sp. CF118]|uniref:DsbA family protein n=1 Tax=Chitinophaga sp. CF118 TaxID=1884367 RepID=UPI0008F4231B|nr:DsbA family protein [Chitinophaga sp. CF118]SFE10338.1 putative protein-disulfide isomerase [Chitinophaga sp. CF118]